MCYILKLVKFESDVGTLVVPNNYANQMLKMIGHSGVIPSALLPEEIPDALANLAQNLQTQDNKQVDKRKTQHYQPEPSLKTRVFPFQQLLEKAIQKHCEILWAFKK